MRDKHGIYLKGEYVRPKLLRENDVCLMESLVEFEYFTKKQMEAINRCRIYLQVVTLADITNGSGSFISRLAYDGTFDYDRQSM